jgi:hypothetical protein
MVFPLVIARTALERLAIQLRKIGPFLCIGKPGQQLPHAGPTAMYVPAQDWESVVQAYIKRAAFVVVHKDLNWNTVKELQWAVSSLGPTRILFWFPRVAADEYEAFRKQASAYLPCGVLPQAINVRFLYFDEQWGAHPVDCTLLDRLTGIQLNVWARLAPFFDQLNVNEVRPVYIRPLPFARILAVVVVFLIGLLLIM